MIAPTGRAILLAVLPLTLRALRLLPAAFVLGAGPWLAAILLVVLPLALFASAFSLGARAFAAGNQRTAFRAAEAFLDANGYALDLGDNRLCAIERLRDFTAGWLSQAGVVEWYRMWMTPNATSL